MKSCPKCQRSYPAQQSSCSDDGETLVLKDLHGLVGRTVSGKYQVEALIGMGGMSAVYRAYQLGVNRRVALKILLPHLAALHENIAVLFEREAQTAGQLSHENVATIYDAGQTEDGLAYLVMEWVDGRTLEDELVRGGPLSLERTAYLLRGIAAALDAAHDKRIVHRDLKPSNIMIGRRPDGRELVKVLDFGLAKVLNDATDMEASIAVGTPHYASPEQFQAGGMVGPRADIYALGIILHRMLSGQLPFNARKANEFTRAHLLEMPTPIRRLRPELPPAVEELILRLLSKDPALRPGRAGEVVDYFERVVRISAATQPPWASQSANGQPQAYKTGTYEMPSTGEWRAPDFSAASSTAPSQARAQSQSHAQGTTFVTTVSGLGGSASLHNQAHSQTGTSFVGQHSAAQSSHTSASQTFTPISLIMPPPTKTQRAAQWLRGHKLAVAVAVGLLVVGVSVLLFTGTGKAALSEKDTVLVGDFLNTTGDQVFDASLQQALSLQLAQTPFLNLFPDEKVRETLKFMNRKPEERLTREVAREVALRRGLKATIVPRIDKLERNYVISLEALNTQSGETVARAVVEAEGKDKVIKAVGRAALDLRGELGESLGTIQKFNAPAEQATTSSLDALNAFSIGREQYNLKDNVPEAVVAYKRALELDPNFAAAYNALAVIYINQGQPELSAQAAAKAYQLRDRVSEREKLNIAALYYSSGTGELEKSMEMNKLLIQLYPRSISAYVNLSVRLNRLGRLEEAVAALNDAMRLDPNNSTAYMNCADLLIRLNRYDQAREIIDRAFANKLDRLGFHATLYQLGFLRDDQGLMNQQLEWVRGKADEFRSYDWQAQTAAFAGKLGASAAFSRQAVDGAKQRKADEVAATLATMLALRQALAGQFPQAQTTLREALALSPTSFTQVSSGKAAVFGPLIVALSGKADQAEEFVATTAKAQPQNTLAHAIWLPITRAAIELERGAPDKAIKLLEPVRQYEAGAFFYPAWLRGQAYLQLRKGPEALAEFQRIIDHRGWEPASIIYPLAHLGAARALRLNGDAGAGRQRYDEFFKFWQNADPNLPVLKAAKKEAATINNR